jgi:hypothetical protein
LHGDPAGRLLIVEFNQSSTMMGIGEEIRDGGLDHGIQAWSTKSFAPATDG